MHLPAGLSFNQLPAQKNPYLPRRSPTRVPHRTVPPLMSSASFPSNPFITNFNPANLALPGGRLRAKSHNVADPLFSGLRSPGRNPGNTRDRTLGTHNSPHYGYIGSGRQAYAVDHSAGMHWAGATTIRSGGKIRSNAPSATVGGMSTSPPLPPLQAEKRQRRAGQMSPVGFGSGTRRG